eukprot:1735295-Pyramimonas_sp.AAC.1
MGFTVTGKPLIDWPTRAASSISAELIAGGWASALVWISHERVAERHRPSLTRPPLWCWRLTFAGLKVDTNTNIGGVPPPKEEDPDLGDS